MALAELTLDAARRNRTNLESAVVRFAGDSGDGIQLTGGQFTLAAAISGSDLATFPDFPAEIRAPAGTTFGVSAFQLQFGSHRIDTIGDRPDMLVALNPAALKVNVGELQSGAFVVIDKATFTARNLKKAGYSEDPREDGSLDHLRVIEIDVSGLTKQAVAESGVSSREQLRAKNFFTLGLVLWMFDESRDAVIAWIDNKFRDQPSVAAANRMALDAGHALGETAEMQQLPAFHIDAAPIEPGLYRNVTGHEALAYGLVDGATKADLKLLFCSYPITPASSILHDLAKLKQFDVTTFQAEDEIAAACAAIGASYAGSIGVTSSSGPGIALKAEAVGLAVAAELPLVIINSQRAGPSTGMPTKTEQSDLFQAVYGRNGDTPLVVLALGVPSDGFVLAREAVRIAVHHMTPVMVLSDGFLANAAEPWLIPDIKATPDFPVSFRTETTDFQPFERDERGVRPWATPGTPGLMHRIGGIERDSASGDISYDPDNHQAMTDARWNKVLAVADDLPEQGIENGAATDKIAIVGWGSTYGPIAQAVREARARDVPVAHIHIRQLWPLPRGLGELLRGYDRIIVPEMNKGQLVAILRSEYLVDAKSLSKVTGKPFTVAEIAGAIADAAGDLS